MQDDVRRLCSALKPGPLWGRRQRLSRSQSSTALAPIRTAVTASGATRARCWAGAGGHRPGAVGCYLTAPAHRRWGEPHLRLRRDPRAWVRDGTVMPLPRQIPSSCWRAGNSSSSSDQHRSLKNSAGFVKLPCSQTSCAHPHHPPHWACNLTFIFQSCFGPSNADRYDLNCIIFPTEPYWLNIHKFAFFHSWKHHHLLIFKAILKEQEDAAYHFRHASGIVWKCLVPQRLHPFPPLWAKEVLHRCGELAATVVCAALGS